MSYIWNLPTCFISSAAAVSLLSNFFLQNHQKYINKTGIVRDGIYIYQGQIGNFDKFWQNLKRSDRIYGQIRLQVWPKP